MDYITGFLSYIPHLIAACLSLLQYGFRAFILRRPTSYPGDPISNPLKRRGDWDLDKERVSIGNGWKFACDDESHQVSQKCAPQYEMSGESAGRQIWYYEEGTAGPVEEEESFCAAINPNSGDNLFRNIMINKWQGERPDEWTRPVTARDASRKALAFYQMIQCEDGHWAGDYGGPMFLMPGLICVLYLTKAPFPEARKRGMIAYLRNHQQVDGGWGTHIECASTMFGTTLSYVALRLLGVEPEASYMVSALAFIHGHGGALYAPSWVSFYLYLIFVLFIT